MPLERLTFLDLCCKVGEFFLTTEMIKEKAIERLNFYAERARKNVLSELECQWDDLSIVDQSTISVSIIEGLKSGVNLSQEFYGHEIEDLSDIHPIQ